jgi:hypothetical protein
MTMRVLWRTPPFPSKTVLAAITIRREGGVREAAGCAAMQPQKTTAQRNIAEHFISGADPEL